MENSKKDYEVQVRVTINKKQVFLKKYDNYDSFHEDNMTDDKILKDLDLKNTKNISRIVFSNRDYIEKSGCVMHPRGDKENEVTATSWTGETTPVKKCFKKLFGRNTFSSFKNYELSQGFEPSEGYYTTQNGIEFYAKEYQIKGGVAEIFIEYNDDLKKLSDKIFKKWSLMVKLDSGYISENTKKRINEIKEEIKILKKETCELRERLGLSTIQIFPQNL